MAHEPVGDARDAALSIYQQVTARFPNGAQRQDLFDEATELIEEKYNHGEIDFPVDMMIRTVLHDADRAQGQRAGKLMKELSEGIQALRFPGDPERLTITILGKGRRKSWQYVTFADAMEMTQLRRDDLKAKTESTELWEQYMAIVAEPLAQKGTVGDLLDSLMDEPGEDPQDEAA